MKLLLVFALLLTMPTFADVTIISFVPVKYVKFTRPSGEDDRADFAVQGTFSETQLRNIPSTIKSLKVAMNDDLDQSVMATSIPNDSFLLLYPGAGGKAVLGQAGWFLSQDEDKKPMAVIFLNMTGQPLKVDLFGQGSAHVNNVPVGTELDFKTPVRVPAFGQYSLAAKDAGGNALNNADGFLTHGHFYALYKDSNGKVQFEQLGLLRHP